MSTTEIELLKVRRSKVIKMYVVADMQGRGTFLKRYTGVRYHQLESANYNKILTTDINEAQLFSSIAGVKNCLGNNVENPKYTTMGGQPKYNKEIPENWRIVKVSIRLIDD